MAGFRGLFVRKDATRGTTPVEGRKSLAGLVASSDAFGARPGVLSGCTVSGSTSGWNYSVSSGHLVTARSAGDGAVAWGNDAAVLVPCPPAPGSNSRIDIVYAVHNDVDGGDGDSVPTFGVASGAAAASPAAPSIPTGAIELGRATLASGAVNTQAASFSTANVQRTAARGAPIPVSGQTQRDAMSGSASLTNPVTVYRRDTGVIERNVGGGWVQDSTAASAWTSYTPTVTGWNLGNGSTDCAWKRGEGNTIDCRIRIQVGTTTTYTGAGLTLTPPVPTISGVRQYGSGAIIDTSPSARYPCTVELASGGNFILLWLDGSTTPPSLKALTDSSYPFVFAANDIVYANITYEAA